MGTPQSVLEHIIHVFPTGHDEIRSHQVQIITTELRRNVSVGAGLIPARSKLSVLSLNVLHFQKVSDRKAGDAPMMKTRGSFDDLEQKSDVILSCWVREKLI